MNSDVYYGGLKALNHAKRFTYFAEIVLPFAFCDKQSLDDAIQEQVGNLLAKESAYSYTDTNSTACVVIHKLDQNSTVALIEVQFADFCHFNMERFKNVMWKLRFKYCDGCDLLSKCSSEQ